MGSCLYFFLWTSEAPLSLCTVKCCLSFRTRVTKTAEIYAGQIRSAHTLNTAFLSASWVPFDREDKSLQIRDANIHIRITSFELFFCWKLIFSVTPSNLAYNAMTLLPWKLKRGYEKFKRHKFIYLFRFE